MKPLSLRETELKEEMKSRCLNKGQYIDENAEEKFKMLCHLEDFEIGYWELKSTLEEIREYIKETLELKEEYPDEVECVVNDLLQIIDKAKCDKGVNNE